MNCPHCGKVVLAKLTKDDATHETSATASDVGDVGGLLDRIHDDELETDFEIDFMRQTRERFKQYGDRIRMSDKQMACLRKIAAK